MKDGETLIVIYAPHFVAGVVAHQGRVIDAAPILRYMLGWDGKQVAAYCVRKRWSWRKSEPKR